MPSLYGVGSQVLNMHDLIHLTDDVEYFSTSLSHLSAFWGENHIGLFKNYVKSYRKPLTQIVNRLQELDSGEQKKNGEKTIR